MDGLNASTISVMIKILSDPKGLKQAQADLTAYQAQVTKGGEIISTAFAAAGVAVAAGAVISGKAAADFQQQMNLIQTNAGASAKEVKNMSKAVLDMAGSVGTTPDELATGLYHIESAGFRGAQALNMLKAAAEGAKNGNADLESVTQAMISLTASHIKGVKDEANAMGILNAIVGSGDMKMQGLADAMSTGIMPAAATFGLSVQDVGAALATLTDNAVPPIDAATRLRMSFSMMAAPSGTAAKALESVGLKSTQLADDMRSKGLFAALSDLKKHLQNAGLTATQQADVLSKAFGGGRSSSAILTLLDQMDRLKSKYGDIKEGAEKFGSSWQTTQKNATFATQKVEAAAGALTIEIGQKLLPEYTKIANKVGTDLVPAFNNTVTWLGKNKVALEVVGTIIAAVVLPALARYYTAMAIKNVQAVAAFIIENDKMLIKLGIQATAFVVSAAKVGIATAAMILQNTWLVIVRGATALWTGAQWLLNAALSANPIGLVIVAVAALAAGIIYAYNHSETFRKIINTLWKDLQDFWKWLSSEFVGVLKDIAGFFQTISNDAGAVMNAIGKVAASSGIPHFATGVTNFGGGFAMVGEQGPELAYLPQGTNVYTNQQTEKILQGGGGSGVTINQTNYLSTPNSPQMLLNNINYALSTVR